MGRWNKLRNFQYNPINPALDKDASHSIVHLEKDPYIRDRDSPNDFVKTIDIIRNDNRKSDLFEDLRNEENAKHIIISDEDKYQFPFLYKFYKIE